MRIVVALRACLCLAFLFGHNIARSGVAVQSFSVGSQILGTRIFSSVGPVGAPGPESGTGATVAWPVTIDSALLGSLPATLQVNLPDRAAVTLSRIRAEQRGGNTLMWTGIGLDCSGLFSISGDGFKSTISCLSAQYGVDHLPNETSLRLSRYDNAGSGTTYEPLPTMPSVTTETNSDSAQATADTTVDVLVLFNGSLTSTHVWNVAQYAIDQAQLAMDGSTSPGPLGHPSIAALKLAGAARISRTVYNDPLGDLRALPADPQVKALRNYWAADVVVYLTTGDAPMLGIANVPGYEGMPPPGPAFAPSAFAAVLLSSATRPGDYVFAHELAHTFGANHNPDHMPANPTPLRPWAFAHWDVETELHIGSRTIMSYVNECTGHPCNRILHYSNPDVYLDWFRTGLDTRNNAAVIREFAPIEAQYRASVGRIFAYGFD